MWISVRVIPRSKNNSLEWDNETLKARLTAAPIGGAANKALVTLLAEHLGLKKRAIRIVRGATARQKTIEIEDLTLEEVMHKLQK